MGKCVSRQSPIELHHHLESPAGEHHQSVLTIALSHQDLAQAHKIWQQLTASNEYIAATKSSSSPDAEPAPFYYTISRRQQPDEVVDSESLYKDAPKDTLTTLDDLEYSTCQEFLFQELLFQAISSERGSDDEAEDEELNQARLWPEPILQIQNNNYLAVSNIDKCLQLNRDSRRIKLRNKHCILGCELQLKCEVILG